MTPIEQQTLATQVAKWVAQGVIEPRRKRQPINNNIVFAAKKTGGVRVCNDCTPVNAVTKDFDWPLPRLQDLRYRIKGFKWFARLDLKDAFFRIGIPAKFRHYTAFTSGGTQYQFRRMPFGVKTGPSVFQQFMDTRLAMFMAFVIIYIDDILICATSREDLKHRTLLVKQALYRAGCTVNEEKSEYDTRELQFAGLTLSAEGVGPNERKVAEVLALACPRTKSDMQSALGLVSYLRDFIPLVSHFTAELYPDRQGARLSPDEYSRQWELLKRHLVSAIRSLRHWDDDAEGDLYADASGLGVGVILIQKGKVVALASRKLTATEIKYSATDREHIALVYAAKKFKIFLHRQGPITRVHSDHAALIGKRSPDMLPKQVRWQSIVNQWMPDVQHVPGKENPADFISRWGLEINGGVEKL